MTPDRWKEVAGTFERALDLPVDERAAFIQTNCNGDEDLRREVESLLESHASAGNFIDEPSLFITDEDLKDDDGGIPPGQLIGAYRVVREIGRGGMGAVYLAERADEQYQKQVAIKLIKRGMDTDTVLRHFRNERQILAGFDHPNIARLFDGGTTEECLPYFVMEYVEGVPIDKYCDAHSLSIVKRLQLFREVCAAVSYAHRHTVIHRDIKQSNILVTADGVPKLLDFGIAKILTAGDQAEALMTMTGMRPMTPEYASPEQVRAEPLTTASDVYSLGVVLYELLTGSSPYRFSTHSPREIEQAITEQQPTRPSTAVARAENPKLDPSRTSSFRNSKILKGDLDNIVLMALRKEPARRYQSVEQLSEDIRRHLENQPVLARKDTIGYRASKFLRRNKVAAAAGFLIVVTLTGGLIATTWQANRAKRRFNDVRQLAHSVLFDYHDLIKDLPGATRVRERLVKDALTYLDGLAREAGGDTTLQRELASAYERVGDVRGEALSASFGDTEGAMDSYFKSLRIREALVAAAPRDAQGRHDLAASYVKLGDGLLETSDAARGFDYLRKALALYEKLSVEQPGQAGARRDLAAIYNDVGSALENRGDWGGALEHHRKAMKLREELLNADPANPEARRQLSVSYCNAGRALYLSGYFDDAIAINRKAIDLATALVAQDPTNAHHRRNLAIYYQNDGDYRVPSGDIKGALESFGKKIALDEQSLKSDPANAQAQDDYAYSCERIGVLLTQLGNHADALARFEKNLTMREKVAAGDPQNLRERFNVIVANGELAMTQAKLGNTSAALEHYGKEMALLQQTAVDSSDVNIRGFEAQAYGWLGRTQVQLASAATSGGATQHWRVGREMFQHSLDIWQDLRARGTLAADDAPKLDEAVREIAKCEAALKTGP